MKSCIALFFMFAVITANAFEWHVYCETTNGMTGNQQLTNAFIQAQSGDTITIHKGTYNLATEEMIFRYEYLDSADGQVKVHATHGTCLFSTVDNLTVQGDPNVSRDEIILDGNGQHAIMRLTGGSCVVRHLTFTRGSANSNYLVYRDGKQLNTDKWIYRRGGGLNFSSGKSVCHDCIFDSCYAGQGASVYGGGEVRACRFINDNAVESNAGCSVAEVSSIYDSYFSGGARGSVRACSGVLSNCVFNANRHNRKNATDSVGLLYYQTGSVIDCAFSNNTAVCIYLHGAKYMPKEIRGCTFAYNSDLIHPVSAGVGGTVPCTVPVKGCTFIGPNQINDFYAKIEDCRFIREKKSSVTVLSGCPNVYRSMFFGILPVGDKILESASATEYVSVVSNCSLYSCHIYDFNIRYGNVLTDVNHMENCLVRNTVVWGRNADEMAAGKGDVSGTFRFTNGNSVDIVNCTFTTNQSNAAYVNNGGGLIRFKNTLFYNNLTGHVRKWGNIDFDAADGETIEMHNCIYKCVEDIAGESSYNWYGKNLSPKFVKDRLPGIEHDHPYAVMYNSPCVDAGDNGRWTSSDLDLAGNKRVYRGVVDIGCYENLEPIPGVMLLVR